MNQRFEDIRSVVNDIIERRTINVEPAIKDDFIKIVFSIRYLISLNRGMIESIWSGIRINEKLTDFVLDSTREFLMRAFNDEYTYEKLCIDIANSHDTIAANGSLIDTDILSCISVKNESMKNLAANPWLVLLLICESIIVMENDNG